VKEATFEEKTIPTMDVMSMIGNKLTKKTIRKVGIKVSDRVSESKVKEDTPHALEKGKTLGGEIGVDEYPGNHNFQDLIKALEKFKVNMPIKDMVEKSPCCMKFLQEILKLDEEPSKEIFISLTKNCCIVQDFQVPKDKGDHSPPK